MNFICNTLIFHKLNYINKTTWIETWLLSCHLLYFKPIEMQAAFERNV